MTAPNIVELEHAIGISNVSGGLHSLLEQKFVYAVGASLAIADASDPHAQTFIRGHETALSCVKVSPDKRFLVTGERGGRSDICIWDAQSLTVLHRLADQSRGVLGVEFAHDSSMVAAMGSENRLAVYDTSNGGLITHTTLGSEAFRDLTFGGRVEDMKRRQTNDVHLAVCFEDCVVAYHFNPFQATLSQVNLKLTAFSRKYSAVRYSSQGDFLFVGSEAGDIGVVNTITGTLTTTCRVCTGGIRSIQLVSTRSEASDGTGSAFKYARFGPGSERSTTLLVSGGDGTVARLLVADHSQPTLAPNAKVILSDACTNITCLENGSVVAATKSGSLFLVNFGGSPTLLSDAMTSGATVLTTHPTQPHVFVTGSKDGLLRQWELNSYRVAGTYENTTAKSVKNPVCSALTVSDGLEVLLSTWSDGAVRCHDMTNFKFLWCHTNAHRSPLTSLVVSPTMKYFVTGAAEGDVRVWDIRTRELKAELKDQRQDVIKMALLGDDRHMVSASRDRTVVTWDLGTSKRLASHETHAGPLTDMVLGPQDSTFFTSGLDHTLVLWDMRFKAPARTISYGNAHCLSMAVSPDGRLLATGDTDEQIRIWDWRRLDHIATCSGHSGQVERCMFTGDSRQMVSCASDNAVMVWNVYA